MLSISLVEFFRTGQFGPVRLGMTRQEVYDFLGEPDGYGSPNTHLMEARVWLYDAIELHFSDAEASPLWLIFSDHLSYPDWWGTSERVELDAWIFAGGRQPSKKEIENNLAEINLPYKYTDQKQKYEDDIVGKFLLDSGVEILIGVKYECEDVEPGKRAYGIDKGWAVVIQNVNWNFIGRKEPAVSSDPSTIT